MCTNSAHSELNRLLNPKASGQTVTVKFAPYMNWGRFNHNLSRVSEVNAALTTAGFKIQLLHDSTEYAWADDENHGYVELHLDGKKMIRINDLQSNKKYRERETRAAKMVRDFIALIAASEKPVAVGRDILAAAPTLKREISAANA